MIREGVRRALSLALRRRDRWEREVEDEIKLHLTLRAEQLSARGLSSEDAYHEAVRMFGSLSEARARLLEAARKRERAMRHTEFLGEWRQDLTFALRTLGRQKAWTAVTILTLALGVGATTAVFSVVSTLLLHPLSYPGADRIAYVDLEPSEGNRAGLMVTMAASNPLVRDWITYAHGAEAIEGVRSEEKQLKLASGETSTIAMQGVLPTWLDFAGARPVIGRMFTTTDIESGRNPILLNEAFWRARLGGRRSVLGQTLTLNDSMYTVVGIAPAGLRFGGPADDPPDIWSAADLRNDGAGLSLMMRLRPGVTYRGLERELDSIAARTALGQKLPFRTVASAPSQRVGFHDSLMLLTWAVALVLLVACANVAHLILARSATRRREMAIRTALGAGRSRLLRQFLTESLLLSVTGAAAGTLLGWIGLRAMVMLRPSSLNDLRVAHVDLTTLGVATAAAAGSAVLFALIGVFEASRHSTHDSLKNGSISAGGARRQGRGRALLVVSEMALSATLLVGATLLVRSVMKLSTATLGFEPHDLYALPLRLSASAFEADASRIAFNEAFLTRLRALPQVKAVTLANVAPGKLWLSIGRLQIQGETPAPDEGTSFVGVNAVKPNYFATMRIPLRAGATFSDTGAASPQVIVNDAFARRHWPNENAVGHRIRMAQSDTSPWMTIVGVASDAKTIGARADATAPVFYTPNAAHGGAPVFLIRTTGGAGALASLPGLARQMGADRNAAIVSIEQTMSSTVAGTRFVMTLLTIFTALALLLAGIGLYGVMAYGVTQRTREIGIRMALGASQTRVARRVILSGAWLALLGTGAGLGTAAWATRFIQNQLYGIERLDPLSFLIGGMVLVGAALLACIVPTLRALAVDPMTAIRAD